MVGPRSGRQREDDRKRLAVGFVFLVGVSASLMAAYGGANAVEVGLVAGFGLVVGLALLLAMGGVPGLD